MGRTDQAGCMVVLIFVVAVLIVAGGSLLQARLDTAAAERDYAEAAKIEARAELAEVRAEAWERRFQLWTVALAAFTQPAQQRDGNDLIVIAAVLAGACGLGVFVLLSRWLDRQVMR